MDGDEESIEEVAEPDEDTARLDKEIRRNIALQHRIEDVTGKSFDEWLAERGKKAREEDGEDDDEDEEDKEYWNDQKQKRKGWRPSWGAGLFVVIIALIIVVAAILIFSLYQSQPGGLPEDHSDDCHGRVREKGVWNNTTRYIVVACNGGAYHRQGEPLLLNFTGMSQDEYDFIEPGWSHIGIENGRVTKVCERECRANDCSTATFAIGAAAIGGARMVVQRRKAGTACCKGCARRDAEIAGLKAQLADLKGEPRPGEDFELTLGGAGYGGYSYTATDKRTGLAVHVDGIRDDVQAQSAALSWLRQCLKDPEGTKKEHWPTCRCGHCFWKEYHEGREREARPRKQTARDIVEDQMPGIQGGK